MIRMEIAVLVVQAIIVGVPLSFILLGLRLIRATYAFNRYFQKTYPDLADEFRNRWPCLALLQISFWESDMVLDETLRRLRRRAITSFLAISALTLLLIGLMSFMHGAIERQPPM